MTEKDKKVLILGGTGAMGVYLVPELLSMGYQVHVAALDGFESLPRDNLRLSCTNCNAKDEDTLRRLLKAEYDAVVDFMIYGTEEFRKRYQLFLENTDHYIFFSSYRVYAGQTPVSENSPRLLDVSDDKEFLATEDYALYKAREEDILMQSGYLNWTAVRPAITYSKRRFQLVTLEAAVVVHRMLCGKTLILPQEAMPVQGTMTWAGDVAKMLARLILNKDAYRGIFTVSTAEHHTWKEIAGYYKKIGGLNYITVDADTYINVIAEGDRHAKWQLSYDRLFDRVIDNRKILNVTGLKQADFMPLYDGLKMELSALPQDFDWSGMVHYNINERMDAYLKKRGLN